MLVEDIEKQMSIFGSGPGADRIVTILFAGVIGAQQLGIRTLLHLKDRGLSIVNIE